MSLNILISIAQAITKDGALSADFTLYLVIGLCTTLISVIFGFILSSINSIKDDVKQIKQDFHSFIEEQKGLNSTFLERTKKL